MGSPGGSIPNGRPRCRLSAVTALLPAKTVTPSSALQLAAAWACVRKTAEMVASLPLHQFEREDGGKVRVEDDLTEILTIRPNRDQTAQEFWEGMIGQQVLRGNAFAEKMFIGRRLVGLRPLLDCQPQRGPDRAWRYNVLDRGRTERLPAEKVFHLRGFGGGDGLGLSAIQYGANALGAALAADETAGRIFSNGMMASGVLTTEQSLTKEQQAGAAGGAGDVHRQQQGRQGDDPGISRLGYDQLQMNPEDAQLLETRRFQVEDICRWFGVPPIIIGHSADGQDHVGQAASEAIMLSWLTLGINPAAAPDRRPDPGGPCGRTSSAGGGSSSSRAKPCCRWMRSPRATSF